MDIEMVGHTLTKLLNERRTRSRVLWLDGVPFGEKQLLGGRCFPWCDTTPFVHAHKQLCTLLKSDVISVSLERFYDGWLDRYPESLIELAGKRRVHSALTQLLADTAPRAQIIEIVTALRATYDEPLVLMLPAIESWISHIHCRANSGVVPFDSDEDTVEGVAVAIADMLRSCGRVGVDGIVISDATRLQFDRQRLRRYAPLRNLAAYYRWDVGIDCRYASEIDLEHGDADFLITRAPVAEETPVFYAGAEGSWVVGQSTGEHEFLHLEVPGDISPEQLQVRLTELRAGATPY
jgi:hypothetical protein